MSGKHAEDADSALAVENGDSPCLGFYFSRGGGRHCCDNDRELTRNDG